MVAEAAKWIGRKVAARDAHGTEGKDRNTRRSKLHRAGSFLIWKARVSWRNEAPISFQPLMPARRLKRAAKNGVLKGLRAEKALAAGASNPLRDQARGRK